MTQLSLLRLSPIRRDPCARKHGGNPESVAAHSRVKKDAYQRNILLYLEKHGPATADAIADAFGVGLNRLSGRFSELNKAGKIERTGEKRKTRTGSEAAVWALS